MAGTSALPKMRRLRQHVVREQQSLKQAVLVVSLWILFWVQTGAQAGEPMWTPAQIKESLGRYQPVLDGGGRPQISVAHPRQVLVELESGGVCHVTRPEERLVATCREGAQANPLRDELARQQRELFVSRVEELETRGELLSLTPAAALRSLLGPTCPPSLCQTTPDLSMLASFPRLSSGLQRFGDVLVQPSTQTLVLGLTGEQGLILQAGSVPRLILRSDLAAASANGQTYRLLALPDGEGLPPKTLAIRQLKRLREILSLCDDDLAVCVNRQAAQAQEPLAASVEVLPLRTRPRLETFPRPAPSMGSLSWMVGGVSSPISFAGQTWMQMEGAVALPPGESYECSLLLSARLGQRQLSSDYVHVHPYGAGVGLGLRAEYYLPHLGNVFPWLGSVVKVQADGIQVPGFNFQAQSVLGALSLGARYQQYALGAQLGLEWGQVLGPVMQPTSWQTYQGLMLGLEFRYIFKER